MPGSWKAPQQVGLEAYLSDIRDLPKLPDTEAAEIFRRAAAGDRAILERIVLANLSLVVGISFKYTGYGLPLTDLISEGNLGLLRAAELFNPKLGVKFSTYASVWIKQRIHRAITAQARVVRIPVWRSQRLRKLDRLHAELNAELGKEAGFSELAERIGLSEESVAELTADRIYVDSLETGDGPDWMNATVDEEAVLPGEQLSKTELMEEITACLDGLDDTELQIVNLKFGLLDKEPVSYREMAPRFGKSREWIRKIGEGALAKIKASLHAAGDMPRVLVEKRQKNVRGRLETLSAKKAEVPKLSLLKMALIQWSEPLIAIL